RYPPNVTVALRLAQALGRHVEDLFGAVPAGAFLEGELLRAPRPSAGPRAKVWAVGDRTLVLPVSALGAGLTYTTPADGLIVGAAPRARGGRRAPRVRVQLLQDARLVRNQVVVAGCDPAIALVAQRLRHHKDAAALLGWPMGSTAAVEAL